MKTQRLETALVCVKNFIDIVCVREREIERRHKNILLL